MCLDAKLTRKEFTAETGLIIEDGMTAWKAFMLNGHKLAFPYFNDFYPRRRVWLEATESERYPDSPRTIYIGRNVNGKKVRYKTGFHCLSTYDEAVAYGKSNCFHYAIAQVKLEDIVALGKQEVPPNCADPKTFMSLYVLVAKRMKIMSVDKYM
jgi:hypothetical protein